MHKVRRDAQAGPRVISRQLLNIAMFVELGLLVLAVCLFFAHGLWLYFYERRIQRLTASARDSLAHLATRGNRKCRGDRSSPPTSARCAGHRLPRDVAPLERSSQGKAQFRRGAGRGRGSRPASLCESNRWSRRLRGARILSRLDVVDPLVQRLLLDPHPAVRATSSGMGGRSTIGHGDLRHAEAAGGPPRHRRDLRCRNAPFLRMGAVVAGPLATFPGKKFRDVRRRPVFA